MLKTKNLISIAATTGLLSLATVSFANDNNLNVKIKNATPFTINQITYKTTLGSDSHVSSKPAEIASGQTGTVVINLTNGSYISGQLSFKTLAGTNLSSTITIMDPTKIYSGNPTFKSTGNPTLIISNQPILNPYRSKNMMLIGKDNAVIKS